MSTLRVLVVDDEAAIRHMVRLHLDREGFEVDEAVDGEEALAKLRAEPYDGVLCDLVMPGIDGMEVIDTLREEDITTPVVLMSAHADVETALKAIGLGAVDYVAKPFPSKDPEMLKMSLWSLPGSYFSARA